VGDPFQKITKAKGLGGMVHMVECLLSQTLYPNPSMVRKKKKKRKKEIKSDIFLSFLTINRVNIKETLKI
jgi:hypothetical protein